MRNTIKEGRERERKQRRSGKSYQGSPEKSPEKIKVKAIAQMVESWYEGS